MYENIETTATEQEKSFATTVYTAYESSFDNLAQMEHALFRLFDILESGQFLSVLQTLFAALDCPALDADIYIDKMRQMILRWRLGTPLRTPSYQLA